MKIARIKISLVVLATMFGMAALTYAQTPPDFSKVEIKTTKITDNFYTLEGQGGTIGVLAGPDGVFLVDTQFAPLTGKIVAAEAAFVAPRQGRGTVDSSTCPPEGGRYIDQNRAKTS